LGATSLVAGTCIGGGMLALPVGTSAVGYLPSMLMMTLCWIYMTITALLILEVTLWMKSGAHIITMASKILGPIGKIVCWITFLFISYASLVAYIDGGGHQLSLAFKNFLGFEVSKIYTGIAFAVLFGMVIQMGKNFIGRANTILFFSLVLAYFMLVFFGASEVRLELLQRQSWRARNMLMLMPILLTTFSFPGIVPSIVPYLKGDVKWLRFAIITGTTITYFVYLIWQSLVLGTIPWLGANGLAEAFLNGAPAIDGLRYVVKNPLLPVIADYFAFFALVTSFIGIALGLFDFLIDGLKLESKKITHTLLVNALIIAPSLFFALYFPRAFMMAMETSGGFGDAILSGIIPVLLIWVGRYKQGYRGAYTVRGGKPLLFILLTIALAIFCLEFVEQVWGITDFTDFR